jgi:hypothetical protein
VVGCHECGNEALGSGATELVIPRNEIVLKIK